MSCSNCKYLDANNKKSGCAAGCLYYCKLKGEYIDVRESACSKYVQDGKDSELVSQMIADCKAYDDLPFSPETYFIFVIILFILGLVMGVF